MKSHPLSRGIYTTTQAIKTRTRKMAQNHQKEQHAYTLIDPQTGPYSHPEEIRAEIEAIRKLGNTSEVQEAIERLESWLKPIPN